MPFIRPDSILDIASPYSLSALLHDTSSTIHQTNHCKNNGSPIPLPQTNVSAEHDSFPDAGFSEPSKVITDAVWVYCCTLRLIASCQSHCIAISTAYVGASCSLNHNLIENKQRKRNIVGECGCFGVCGVPTGRFTGIRRWSEGYLAFVHTDHSAIIVADRGYVWLIV